MAEQCPKCTRARIHGWHKADKFKHNEACRKCVEAELAQTARGRARLDLTAQRRERWESARSAPVVEPAVAEGERVALDAQSGPPAPPPKGAAPPQSARVRPIPPTTTTPKSNVDDDWSDVEGGADAPMTPNDMPDAEMDVDYAPTSAGSIDESRDAAMHIETIPRRLKRATRRGLGRGCASPLTRQQSRNLSLCQRGAPKRDADIAPKLQLCGATMSAAQEIRVANASIFNPVQELGGDSRRYIDERRQDIMNLVSEVYNQPRITRAARFLH